MRRLREAGALVTRIGRKNISEVDQWLNGRLWMMRYASVGSTCLDVPRLRRRLAFLVESKWRLPARERMTLPVPVILNRLATDFFVLIPLGRLIKSIYYKR